MKSILFYIVNIILPKISPPSLDSLQKGDGRKIILHNDGSVSLNLMNREVQETIAGHFKSLSKISTPPKIK